MLQAHWVTVITISQISGAGAEAQADPWSVGDPISFQRTPGFLQGNHSFPSQLRNQVSTCYSGFVFLIESKGLPMCLCACED